MKILSTLLTIILVITCPAAFVLLLVFEQRDSHSHIQHPPTQVNLPDLTGVPWYALAAGGFLLVLSLSWLWRWLNEPQPGHNRHELPLEYLDGEETKHAYILRFRGEPSRENLEKLSPMPRDRVLSTDEGFEVVVNKRNQGGQSRARLLDDYERFAARRMHDEPYDSKDWDM